MRFETEEAVYRFTERALILPANASEVRMTRQQKGRVIVVDNGILTAKVAPSFLGSVISLQREGREYLNSSYPDAAPRGWMNPWHGGISPAYGRLWETLYKERFRYRVIERKGRQGLVWRGVRVHCRIAQEQARGQSIAVEYLLAPGADVLAILPSSCDEMGDQRQWGTWASKSGRGSPPHPGPRRSTTRPMSPLPRSRRPTGPEPDAGTGEELWGRAERHCS